MEEHSEGGRWAWAVRLFDRTILQYPGFFVLLSLGVAAFYGYHLKDYRLDASSETIILEGDKDLRYYNETRDLFGSDDYIIVTTTPSDDLFSPKNLKIIEGMTKEFAAMSDVQSVTSILNVPLFHSPDVQFFEMATGYKTLLGGADIEQAKKELTESPLYKDYLISADGKTSAIQVTFRDPPAEYQKLYRDRRDLRIKRDDTSFNILGMTFPFINSLNAEEKKRLAEIDKKYAGQYEARVNQNKKNIQQVRDIVAKHEKELGKMHIGGVPMIMADMIAYVGNDIQVFGVIVFLLVLVTLGVLYRSVKWIIIPTAVCVLTLVVMMGYQGYTDWPTTVVTANFPALLVVITLVTAIHVVAHYREIYARNPEWTNRQITLKTVEELAVPCFYTSLTTVVGFSSLITSGIRPVIDFGVIGSFGVMVAYVVLFIFLPAALQFFPKGTIPPKELAQLEDSSMRVYARVAERHGGKIYGVCALVLIICGYGVTELKVENRFIDYFRKSTEIFAGMTDIDQRLGGTTPLEIVLEGDGPDFWLDPANRAKLREIHQRIDELPESGKVISPDTLLQMAESVYQQGTIPTPILKQMLKVVPQDLQNAVVGPYMTPQHDQVRIAMRVRESSHDLSRKDLMAKLDEYFKTADVFKDGKIKPHVTGVFVLYNNMLQSLFNSQIRSIASIYVVVWIMFLVLFRSFSLAVIAFLPSIPPVALTLGVMGIAQIPLNIMTMMSAGVSLGESVDFALHYIHRFKIEFEVDKDYKAAMYRCHNSIGRAMYYTTITTVVGFSIVCFSNFIPNVYFGLFTALDLLASFFVSLTLLPLILITWKPLGPDAVKLRAMGKEPETPGIPEVD